MGINLRDEWLAFSQLMEHYGHPIRIEAYGDDQNFNLVTIECRKCDDLLMNFNRMEKVREEDS